MTTLWFYVAALSLEHADAVQAMEGQGFDGAGRYKEHAPARASLRADMLLVCSADGLCNLLGAGPYPCGCLERPYGLHL